MLKKPAVLLAAGFSAVVLALVAGTLWRPIHIDDHGKTHSLRAAVFTVGQALYAAGISLDPNDQVEPALDRPLFFNRQIRIRRALHVYLWGDGRLRPIIGPEGTAAGALARAGVRLEEGDRLWSNGQPLDPNQPLPGGRAVVLRVERARQVELADENGVRAIHSTGPTAAHALWEAGVRVGPGDRLSVDPGATLEADLAIGYRPARPLTIRAGGQAVRARSSAETVGEALAEAGVALQGLDYSWPAEDQPLPEDGAIRVVRVREEIHLDETLVPFENLTAPDPETEIGQTRTMVPGRYGVRVERERARFEDGQEVSRGFDSDWVASEPVPQTVGIGTKVVVKTLDTPDGEIEYWREMSVYATSYSPCRLGTGDGRCGYTTASGLPLTKGIIAVTLPWYRLLAGQQVYVPGYGRGVIADVGKGIPGTPWIDLGFDEDNFQGIVGWVTLYFLTPAPENPPWLLP